MCSAYFLVYISVLKFFEWHLVFFSETRNLTYILQKN